MLQEKIENLPDNLKDAPSMEEPDPSFIEQTE